MTYSASMIVLIGTALRNPRLQGCGWESVNPTSVSKHCSYPPATLRAFSFSCGGREKDVGDDAREAQRMGRLRYKGQAPSSSTSFSFLRPWFRRTVEANGGSVSELCGKASEHNAIRATVPHRTRRGGVVNNHDAVA